MQLSQADLLARRLRGARWFPELEDLGAAVRTRRSAGRLLLVGHPSEDPWHLAAHLETLAAVRSLPSLTPTLVREGRLEGVHRADTVLLLSERKVPDWQLERLDAARARGTTVLGLSTGDPDLAAVAHAAVALDLSALGEGPPWLMRDFETASHLLGSVAAAAVRSRRRASRLWGRPGPTGARRR